MRLATIEDGTRDGSLAIVRRDGLALTPATAIARTLQQALDDWARVEPRLRALAADVDRGAVESEPVRPERLRAPLPRAFEWVDGSAYLGHVRLVRQARGAPIPPTLETDPLVYQGGSGALLGPRDPIPLLDASWGLDFEGEVCAVLADVPQGTRAADALLLVRLLCLANDVTFRELVPSELAKGFGFFQSKPATAFSPFAATPDELGPAWRGGRVHLRLEVTWNGRRVGDCDAGPEMHFSFPELVQHIARTRAFCAGTILGSGTVSNADPARGASCLAEQRMREILAAGPGGRPTTRFMDLGDRVEIDMHDAGGRSVFGRIVQEVV
jgi:fumarylacetoacetate (FAA) hydrolase